MAALSVPAVVAGGCGDGGADAGVAAGQPTNAPEVDSDGHDPAVVGSPSTEPVSTGSSITVAVGPETGGSSIGSSRPPSTDASSGSSSTTTTVANGDQPPSPTTTSTAPTTALSPAPRTGVGGCAGVEGVLAASTADRAAASASGDQRRYWSDDPDALKATLFAEPPVAGWSANYDGGCAGPPGAAGGCGDSYDDKLALNEHRVHVIYSRSWADDGSYRTGGGYVSQTVYEFETTDGAAAYLEDAARFACSRPDVVETFEVPQVQGAIGFTLAKEYDTDPLTDVVLYSPRAADVPTVLADRSAHRSCGHGGPRCPRSYSVDLNWIWPGSATPTLLARVRTQVRPPPDLVQVSTGTPPAAAER